MGAFAAAVVVGLLAAAPAHATPTPSSATLTPNPAGQGRVTWTGTMVPGSASGGVAEDCFDPDTEKPDPASGCDFFTLNVSVPSRFYEGFLGGVEITLGGFAAFGGSGNFPGESERTLVSAAQGSYYVVMVPYAIPPGQSYQGAAQFKLKRPALSLPALNNRGPRGAPNYRASHDRYNSHSETTIAQDPLNHDHLIAGSKMYENLEKYFFKVGTYESFDGGRHWRDYGHLPGYCQAAGQCDPNDDERYRVT